MKRRLFNSTRIIRLDGTAAEIPKFRSTADERLSEALKRAVNRESAPASLEASVRAIFRESPAES